MSLSKPSSTDPIYTPGTAPVYTPGTARGANRSFDEDSVETIEDLIRDNYTLLSRKLQVEKLIPHFIERRLLDITEDKQVIMSKTTTPGKAEALLELLAHKGKCTPEEFVEILKKGDHRHVADQLKRTSTRNEATKGPSDAADDVIACLNDLYATEYAHVRPLPWCEDLNLHLGDVYTNLRLQRMDGRGRFEDTDTIVSLADVYNTGESEDSHVQVSTGTAVRKIRVEGDPGIGKSCSCQKLAYDWSCGKLDRFKVVFFLEMRHLAGKVKDEIFEQLLPKDTKITPDQLWSYIQENQDDVLFILDGLDELSQKAREGTDVVDFIQGKILRNCHVLVTSRPYHCVKDLDNCHQFYKIVGYSRKDSESFIRKYFCESLESASKLVEQLHSDSSLSEIVVNPLNNVLICVVWEDNNEELPSSKDELYQDIVNSVAKRFREKKYPSMERDKLPSDIEEAMRGLGKLAWEGLEQEQLQFNVEVIRNKYGTNADNMLNMGLLTRDYSFSRIRRTCYCAFLHKTFQEYMAARYVSGLVMDGSSREEGMKCLRSLFGLNKGTEIDRELILSSRHKYREVHDWLLLILGKKTDPLFDMFAEELKKAQTDEDRDVLSFVCVMWLGKTRVGVKMAEIVAPYLSKHLTNNLGNLSDRYDHHIDWFVGLTYVLTSQKKLAASNNPRLTQHLTVNCSYIIEGSEDKETLHKLENTLSDYDAIKHVTLLEPAACCRVVFAQTSPTFAPLRIFIPQCGTEIVSIHMKHSILYEHLKLLRTLKQLLGESKVEHVTVTVDSSNCYKRFSVYDVQLAEMIVGLSSLRSLRIEIGKWTELRSSTPREFGNLIATLQSISEHPCLEAVELHHPSDDPNLCLLTQMSKLGRKASPTQMSGGTVMHEIFDVRPMMHKLTDCIKKNKALKTLKITWIDNHEIKQPAILDMLPTKSSYHGECCNQSLSSLCSVIRENRTLETLVVEGMFYEPGGHQDIIDELIRNKPDNYKELRITILYHMKNYKRYSFSCISPPKHMFNMYPFGSSSLHETFQESQSTVRQESQSTVRQARLRAGQRYVDQLMASSMVPDVTGHFDSGEPGCSHSPEKEVGVLYPTSEEQSLSPEHPSPDHPAQRDDCPGRTDVSTTADDDDDETVMDQNS